MAVIHRRIVAGFALAAVMWAALWPVVTTAHALVSSEAMPLCHQAGLQVGADEPAMDSSSGAPQPAKLHCPLCIMAFLAVGSAPAIVAAERIPPSDLARDVRDTVQPADLSARLPESRAPPSLLA